MVTEKTGEQRRDVQRRERKRQQRESEGERTEQKKKKTQKSYLTKQASAQVFSCLSPVCSDFARLATPTTRRLSREKSILKAKEILFGTKLGT